MWATGVRLRPAYPPSLTPLGSRWKSKSESRALENYVEDCGGAFLMGTRGSSVSYAIKGFHHPPVGVNQRLRGSLTAIKTRPPQLGGGFAVWGGLFSMILCWMVHVRKTSGIPSQVQPSQESHWQPKGTSGHSCWVSCDWWHSPRVNWRSWYLIDKICLCVVSQWSSVC